MQQHTHTHTCAHAHICTRAHTHIVLTTIFQASLGKLVAPSVAQTGRRVAIGYYVLQPVLHQLISTTVAKGQTISPEV